MDRQTGSSLPRQQIRFVTEWKWKSRHSVYCNIDNFLRLNTDGRRGEIQTYCDELTLVVTSRCVHKIIIMNTNYRLNG